MPKLEIDGFEAYVFLRGERGHRPQFMSLAIAASLSYGSIPSASARIAE